MTEALNLCGPYPAHLTRKNSSGVSLGILFPPNIPLPSEAAYAA